MYVKFATLAVDDVDRAIAFYTGKLRLTLATDAALRDGGRWVELALPDGPTRLILELGAADRDRSGPALILIVPDVAMAFERLESLGVVFVTPPATAPWDDETRYAILEDSERNLILIEQE